MDKKDNRLLGMAGEHRIVSELLLRGYNPSIAVIDKGVDIILDNGKTIQVKTTAQVKHGAKGNSVAIDISSTTYTRSRLKGMANPTDLRADYFIVWIVPRNEFYIIPRDAIAARNVTNCLSITPDLNQGFAIYKDKWDLLEGK